MSIFSLLVSAAQRRAKNHAATVACRENGSLNE